ncbi:nuclear transport factor 2 family protein [Streptomyces hirsutus]|uniref:nuclear transport factor 2 family protein n=1 Tax=Streptomyces hirsutus TaxID=35620 RepID=UPI00362B7F42
MTAADTTSVAEEALALEDRRWQALIAQDIGTLRSLFDDELSYTHSNGLVDTAASYLGSLEAGTVRYVAVDRSDTRVTVYGPTSIVTGEARISAQLNGNVIEIRSRYSAVWTTVNGTWRFVCWHASPVLAS